MKYIFLLFILSFISVTSYAQQDDVEEYTDRFLSSSVEEQQEYFKFLYSFEFEMMHEDQRTGKNRTRTLQIVKNEIEDTIKPFFNTVLVNEHTLARARDKLREESKLQYLMNSELFTKRTKAADLKVFKGTIQYNVTDFPYQKFLQVYSNITSITDSSGKNLLVSGHDTLDTRSISKWDGMYAQSADFKYDNTEHPKVLIVSGTVTIKVPAKFLITTFLSSEVGRSKLFQQDTFTLRECAAGNVIVSSTGKITGSDSRLVPVGPFNVEYKHENGFLSGGVFVTDEFMYNMVNDHDAPLNGDTLLSAYFDQYVDYLKKGPVKLMTVYCDKHNQGNIQKVYIVKPIEYITITESFSIESKD